MSDDPANLFETAMQAALEYRRTVADGPAHPLRSYHEIVATLGAPMPQAGEAPEQALNFVAATVGHAVIFPRQQAVGIGRNDRLVAQRPGQCLRLITLVGAIHNQLASGRGWAARLQ